MSEKIIISKDSWLVPIIEKAAENVRLYEAIRTKGVKEQIVALLDEIGFKGK